MHCLWVRCFVFAQLYASMHECCINLWLVDLHFCVRWLPKNNNSLVAPSFLGFSHKLRETMQENARQLHMFLACWFTLLCKTTSQMWCAAKFLRNTQQTTLPSNDPAFQWVSTLMVLPKSWLFWQSLVKPCSSSSKKDLRKHNVRTIKTNHTFLKSMLGSMLLTL